MWKVRGIEERVGTFVKKGDDKVLLYTKSLAEATSPPIRKIPKAVKWLIYRQMIVAQKTL